jgi:arginine/lysine/ornithine decarboxylase
VNSLIQQLLEYVEDGMYSFHTPGHKGRKEFFSQLDFPAFDLTELPGLDMLHNPAGVIAESQRKAAKAYGADETFFLLNGATSGNHAMFTSLMSSMKGKKIRIDRRAHRSVTGALIISGLVPEYVSPIVHPEFNLPLGIDVKHYSQNLEHIGACHITSPSYFGTTVDIQAILQFRDKQAPALPVLVDQAHGAHFFGERFPCSAVLQGADAVVHSTHKTMNAMTQAAMLHVKGERIDRTSLKSALEFLLTSSPNYVIMSSLENAVHYLDKQEIWDDLYEEVISLQKSLEGSLRILTARDTGTYGINEVDWSKILVNTSALQIPAGQAVEVLRTIFRIEPELWNEQNILFMLGIGNKPQEVRQLREALEYLVKEYGKGKGGSFYAIEGNSQQEENKIEFQLPPIHLTPREAWFIPKKMINIQQAQGKIAGETISIYPPGIPLIAAGEEIIPSVLEYLNRAGEYNWQGWQGFNSGQILVADV